MEKLEKKIEGIISDHCGIVSINYDGMRDTICSEIQSIAVGFAEFVAINEVSMTFKRLDDPIGHKEDLFKIFINNHYNK